MYHQPFVLLFEKANLSSFSLKLKAFHFPSEIHFELYIYSIYYLYAYYSLWKYVLDVMK